MENIKKIMVAFDLSEYSREALEYACKLADNFKADLIVANVIHQRDVEAVRMVELASTVFTSSEYIETQKEDRSGEIDKVTKEFSCDNNRPVISFFSFLNNGSRTAEGILNYL